MATPELKLSLVQATVKRTFDFVLALLGLIATCWLILPAWVAASVDTRANGFFTQARIGRHGRVFQVVKIRTMRNIEGFNTTVTTGHDPRITWLGRIFRRTKLDELPQLWNVLLGQMSFVGPRPDVPGFADHLEGEDRLILLVRPGITGPASVYFRDEELFLAEREDPERFNEEVLWPAKVKINLDYIQNYRFIEDVRLIVDSAFPALRWSHAAQARANVKKSQKGSCFVGEWESISNGSSSHSTF